MTTRAVDILVYDGVDELDVFGPLQVFRRAERLGAPIATRLVTPRPQPRVTGSFGVDFAVDATYEWSSDVLIVPGGNWNARGATGAWAEVQRAEWLADLGSAANTAEITAGVCTGALLLAAAGVIGTRPATTHHAALKDLAAYGVTPIHADVLDANALVTSGGVTNGIDLALHLIGRLCDTELADRIATAIEYHPSPATFATDL